MVPPSPFSQDVRDGLPGRFDARRTHLHGQLLVDANAHWVRRVALEGLDRLIEG